MSVSLCMIDRNEEKQLGACLESAAGLADQIVVVDTGSTDDTKGIAARHGASIYDFAWTDDFSAARNESIRRRYCRAVYCRHAPDPPQCVLLILNLSDRAYSTIIDAGTTL